MSETDRKPDILDDPNKGIEEAENIPARLFRTMLLQLNIHPWRWAQLLSRYVADPRNNIPQTRKDINHARGNMNKELKKSRITFPTLMRGIRLFNPVAVTFRIELEWRNQPPSIHSYRTVLNRNTALDDNAVEAISSPEDQRFDY